MKMSKVIWTYSILIFKFYFVRNHFADCAKSFQSDLDTRVVDLEENGGSDGNSSVAELEVRGGNTWGNSWWSRDKTDIEGLIISFEFNCILNFDYTIFTISIDLGTTISDQEVRISAAEENIQGTISKMF